FQYNDRSAELSLEVFRVLRENNLALLQALPIESWDNYGMHLERGKETIAHIARMFAGHDLNHLQQIERIAAQVAPAKPRAGKAKSKPKSGSKRRKKGGSTKRRK